MKKKIFSLLIMLCFMIPCSFLFVSCGKKESKALTISYTINSAKFGSDVVFDETNKTITWTYNTNYNIDDSYFNIVGTDANGGTSSIEKATETTIGYKVDSTLPANRTCVPAGSYTLKLYCDESDDGLVKFGASESTWTIVVEKKTVDCAEFEWSHRTTNDLVYTPGESFGAYLDSTISAATFANFEGVIDFEYDETSNLTATNAGTYTTKVNYTLDTNNYNHINLPEKAFTWTIAKADPKDYLSFEQFWGEYANGYVVEYDPAGPVGVSSLLNSSWEHLAKFGFTGNFEGTSMTTEPGTYTVRPIFTEQEDTNNWIEYDPEYYELTWTVVPKTLNLSVVEWNYSEAFEYDEDVTREISLINLPEGVTVSYTNNTAKDAGTYEATATISFDSKYYKVPDETNLTFTLTWVINPADEPVGE